MEIQKDYEEFLNRVQTRNEVVNLSELGETPEALKLNSEEHHKKFIFGADKEATQLAIIMKYMHSENLHQNPGVILTEGTSNLVYCI